ncbi:DUF1707 SHOCT-like domain-containing protein [Micromonospora sp. LOL_021]|uniref:DUF1707 SHOCT-like domain-containing protein n=1 Tax=Micromonospora sp. LOL_021 TaxID=3345417 RepID=UPI003A86BE3E
MEGGDGVNERAGDERVGDAQRNYVVELLARALGEGYLDLTEYERRLVEATAATTSGELAAQLTDLPRRFHWDPRTPVVGSSVADRAWAGRTSAALIMAVASLPFAACYGAGAVFAVAAIVLAGPGRRVPGQRARALAATVIGSVGVFGSVMSVVLLLVVG